MPIRQRKVIRSAAQFLRDSQKFVDQPSTCQNRIPTIRPRLGVKLAILAAIHLLLGGVLRADDQSIIRVGVSDYQALEDSYARYVNLFSELSSLAPREKPITFQVAIGSYGEVREWYASKRIDVAILAAMPMAELLGSAGSEERERILDAYIGTLGEHIEPEDGECSVSDLFPAASDLEETKKRLNVSLYYRTALLVRDDSPLKSVADLSDPKLRDRIKYLFVRPYSVSGYILPNSFLLANKLQPALYQREFTYQHDESLKRLLSAVPNQYELPVAFVYEAAKYENASCDKPQFRRLEDPVLDSARIPENAVLVNEFLTTDRIQQLKETLATLFRSRQSQLESNSSQFRILFQNAKKWAADYAVVQNWLRDAELPQSLLYRSTLDDIIEDLEHRPKFLGKPRLALVLSGGGAKCAYQAGAIAEIEKHLAKARSTGQDIDINLVVGTSGGSINALLVALGVTRSPNGQALIKSLWENFDDKDFFQLASTLRFFVGLTLGLLQALLISLASFAFVRPGVRWFPAVVVLAVMIGAGVVILLYVGSTLLRAGLLILVEVSAIGLLIYSLRLLSKILDDWWQLAGWLTVVLPGLGFAILSISGRHTALWLTRGSPVGLHFWNALQLIYGWVFVWSLPIGLLMAVSGYWFGRGMKWHPYILRTLSVFMVCASIFLVWDVFVREKYLSQVDGIKLELAKTLPRLVGNTPHLKAAPLDNVDGVLKSYSAQLVESGSSELQRDLVVTASRLPNSGDVQVHPFDCQGAAAVDPNSLPTDLYFYLPGTSNGVRREPRVDDPHYISFLRNPSKLLNVVIGSSTIYPVFPSQPIDDVCLGQANPSQWRVPSMKIVDGGYVHNSPIDAAVRWGATHVILIEASPRISDDEPKNFLQNATYAFNFLFEQAQRIDREARNGVELFELRPTSQCDRLFRHRHTVAANDPYECDNNPEPDIGLFDFQFDLLHRAVQAGENDVGNVALFERVAGPPDWREAKASLINKGK